MTINEIKNNVQALLNSTGSFSTVLSAPPNAQESYAGYPAASHYFVAADSDYATVTQNRRRYEYLIEIIVMTTEATPTSTELNQIYTLTDSIVQLLEESIDLSSTALGLTKACDIMKVSPADLTRITTNEGVGLMMTVRLFCEADMAFR